MQRTEKLLVDVFGIPECESFVEGVEKAWKELDPHPQV
jgi:hypothetical protein